MSTFEHKDIILDSDSLEDACWALDYFGYLPSEFDHDKIHSNPLIVQFIEDSHIAVGTESFKEWKHVQVRAMEQLKFDLGITVKPYQRVDSHYISREPALDKSVELFSNWVFENMINDGVSPNDELTMWADGEVQCHFPIRVYGNSYDQGRYERALSQTIRNLPVGSVWVALWSIARTETAWIYDGTNMCHVGSYDPRPAELPHETAARLQKESEEGGYW